MLERGRDRYGRLVGVVYVNAKNVNREMVRQGMAWVYRQYATEPALFRLEEEAKAERRGLWVDSDAIPPWQYRHGVGQKRRNRRKIAPKAAPPIIGSVKSKIYHWQGCPNYRRLSAQHQVFFENKAAAEEAGFRAARNCP